MQEIVNIFFKVIKWPIAALMVALFMPVFKADMHLIEQTMQGDFLFYFVAPMAAVIALWFVIPGLAGSHFAIFEHEFTHMVAALLTFHRPRSMEINPDKGGSFGFYGKGNWFITIAPYFLPTFPVLMIVLAAVWTGMEKTLPEMFLPVLGAMFGYHLISNFMQIHGEQSDFKKAGWIFAVLFLPTANLLTAGFVWAFAAKEWLGVNKWFSFIADEIEYFIAQFL